MFTQESICYMHASSSSNILGAFETKLSLIPTSSLEFKLQLTVTKFYEMIK